MSTADTVLSTPKPDFRTLEQAADWYATLRSEEATDLDRQAWKAWLDASPRHAQAWRHIEAVGRRFSPLQTDGAEAALAGFDAARRGGKRRRQALGSLGGLLALGLTGWLGWRHTGLPAFALAWTADYRTHIGEQREISLADGSRVWLNTDSALNVNYDSRLRQLKLVSGEIWIETAADPHQRPFYVETRFGRMQALGTRFTVRHDALRTRLDVFEGVVEILNMEGQLQRVAAGESADFTADQVSPLAPAERAREAWRRGIIVADQLPLGELVEELARYQRGHIGVSPDIAHLEVMGVYPAHDTEQALAMLAGTLPIRIRQTMPWWITIDAR